MERQPNTQYCLSISYGKDSLACLGAIEKLGLPLDRIIHAEVWATQDIPADLPPMVEFKAKADKIIKERWGIEVEHIYATDKDNNKISYQDIFYRTVSQKCLDKRERERALEELGTYTDFHLISERGVTQNLKLLHLTMPNIQLEVYGFPMMKGQWCNSNLKMKAINFLKKVKARWFRT